MRQQCVIREWLSTVFSPVDKNFCFLEFLEQCRGDHFTRTIYYLGRRCRDLEYFCRTELRTRSQW